MNELEVVHNATDATHQRAYPRLPEISLARRNASLNISSPPTPSTLAIAAEKKQTFLYLAYGSNLCNETFRGRRGIRPLSQINVVVPSLRLTFDLAGFPYQEPCFANSALRLPQDSRFEKTSLVADCAQEEKAIDPTVGRQDYHKNRWHKGMVGCVYEVTASDYAHIIATEGGGTAYKDILVPCYPLVPGASTVPTKPTTPVFNAHTLFAPSARDDASESYARPNPDYAQPSARYLGLITTGAEELALPAEYKEYLNGIRTYTVTTRRQMMGQALMARVWLPFVMMLMALAQKYQDKDGKTPKWLGRMFGALFLSMWICYDLGLKRIFGDGERTIGDDEDGDEERRLMGRSTLNSGLT